MPPKNYSAGLDEIGRGRPIKLVGPRLLNLFNSNFSRSSFILTIICTILVYNLAIYNIILVHLHAY